MAADTSVATSIISAVSVIAGVCLGSFLTWLRDALQEKKRIKGELNYLAILVVAHLDRFVDGCLDVAFDDGTREGRPAGTNGEYHVYTTVSPTFDPFELKVDWKALPGQLMYGILNLPSRTEKLLNQVSAMGQVDDPPDYQNTFLARQHGFAVLGLEVSELARQLREHARLPIDVSIEGEWNRDDAIREQRDKIASEIATYEAHQAAIHKQLMRSVSDAS